MKSNSAVILSEASPCDAKSKHPDTSHTTGIARTFLPIVFLLFALLTAAHPAHAQGCAQCLDTTRATPPAVQAAYRHAILLLIAAASALFITGVILIRREP